MPENYRIPAIALETVELSVILAKDNALTVFFVLAGLFFLLLSFIGAIYFLKQKLKKDDLMRNEILPELGSKFGKLVSVSEKKMGLPSEMSFERDGTIFHTEIKRTDFPVKPTHTEYKVQFTLPDIQEKFYIHNTSSHFLISSKYPSDSQAVFISSTPEGFTFHSPNTRFLQNLLEKEKISNELRKYPGSRYYRLRITFENGVFTVFWIWTAIEDTETEAKNLEQICQTAVVFYDGLSKR